MIQEEGLTGEVHLQVMVQQILQRRRRERGRAREHSHNLGEQELKTKEMMTEKCSDDEQKMQEVEISSVGQT